MAETQMLVEEDVECKEPLTDSSEKGQPADVEMEESAGDSAEGAAEADEADGKLVVRSEPTHADGDNVCTLCGFSAKYPRSLKIHRARKHGKNFDQTPKADEENPNTSDVSPADIQQEAVSETEKDDSVLQKPNPDEASNNDGTEMSVPRKGSSYQAQEKQWTVQEEPLHSQERRLSKRTPKPKIIHSCNYCGQEFRDKSPLDVHVQRYHTKDVPFTCEYSPDLQFQIHENMFKLGFNLK